MPGAGIPREVQRIAIPVAMPQDQSVEEHKREGLFPVSRNEIVVLPERKKGAAAKATNGICFKSFRHYSLTGAVQLRVSWRGDRRGCFDRIASCDGGRVVPAGWAEEDDG